MPVGEGAGWLLSVPVLGTDPLQPCMSVCLCRNEINHRAMPALLKSLGPSCVFSGAQSPASASSPGEGLPGAGGLLLRPPGLGLDPPSLKEQGGGVLPPSGSKEVGLGLRIRCLWTSLPPSPPLAPWPLWLHRFLERPFFKLQHCHRRGQDPGSEEEVC